MFDLISYLKSIGELKGGKALDLGCGDGKLVAELQEEGYDAIGVDKKVTETSLNTTISCDIKDFEIKPEIYDLITCRFVLPFLPSMPAMIDKMYNGLKPGGIMFYNYFGTLDPWNPTKGMTFTDDCLQPEEGKELYGSSAFYVGPKMDGELKEWHTYTYVIAKPK